ncbi:MAG: DrmB family protein, partial [Ruminococcus sp.]
MPRPTFRKKNNDNDGSISIFSNEKISVGDIRKTQLITTFGVGSIVDFKDDTVIIAATDDWDYNTGDNEEVESRKIFNENLSVITGAEYFLMPRTRQSTNSFSKEKNIPSYVFPEKLHCSRCGNIYDFRELNTKERHKCPQCKNNLTASRFITVCPKGHMDDFPYDWWVHNGNPCPSGIKSPRIRMINIYNRTDIDSLRLECTECKATRSMVQVFSENALSEFRCTCKHPHFKDPYARAQYGCHEKMRARLRSASGVYFPITKSALLIPPWSKKVVNCIQKHYSILKSVDEDKIANAIRTVLHGVSITDDEIIFSWKAVKNSMEQRQQRSELSVYENEYAILSKEENQSADNFKSYSSIVPEKYKPYFDQLVVIEKLTVTQAFTGFTRIIRNETNTVPVSQYPKPWLPAVELNGEGIFI